MLGAMVCSFRVKVCGRLRDAAVVLIIGLCWLLLRLPTEWAMECSLRKEVKWRRFPYGSSIVLGIEAESFCLSQKIVAEKPDP